MLVCPYCQFENPNTNKFCQNCGTSLIHNTCYNCKTQVPLEAERCHNCGAFTGTVWRAIVSKEPDTFMPRKDEFAVPLQGSERVGSDRDSAKAATRELLHNSEGERLQSESSPPMTSANSSAPASRMPNNNREVNIPASAAPAEREETSDEDVTQPLSSSSQPNSVRGAERDNADRHKDEVLSPISAAVYLDKEQRYRLLEPQRLDAIATDTETYYEITVRVLDCQPFQKSLLAALMEQTQTDGSETLEARGKQASALPSDAWKDLGIPAIAQPYLALKKYYYQTLPTIHDAWQHNGETIVLLEDRSEWQSLADLWGNEQLPTIQILYWLDEMAKLWEALEPWRCRQSLLETTNLRVDEDQALGLMRLYPEFDGQQLSLQDLGQMWQRLFDQSQRTQFTTLTALFRQMCTREIGTIHELRSHLEAIARQSEGLTSHANKNNDVVGGEMADSLPSDTGEEQDADSTQIQPEPYEAGNNDSDIDPTLILPMQLLSLDDAGCTDIGLQRKRNEDFFGIQTQIQKLENPMGRSVQARGLYILCDGMGGHDWGDVASGMAVETLKRYFQDHWQDDQLPGEETIREAIHAANQAIYEVNQKNARSGSGRMGTTLAMMLVHNTNAVIAHVGDSRVYRLTRKRGLEQVTIDHEVAQREIARGVPPEIAYARPDANQLTQALGPRSEQFVEPDIQFFELNEDTLFIICSDGLSDNDLVEAHWQTHLAPLLSSRANLDQGILQLIELANERNGYDNITAILIRVKVRPNFEQQQLLYR